MTDILVLSAKPNRSGTIPVLTKRFEGDTVHSYDRPFTFDAESVPIANIDDLHMLLTALEDLPHSCVVRGELIDPTIRTDIRRLKDPSIDRHGNTIAATIRERHQPWLLMDFDKVPAPSRDITNSERLEYLVSLLPIWFRNVSYHFRWSASAGRDGFETLSAHLWFWLSEAWDSETIRDRIRDENWEGVDTAPFSANQVHYTAKPIFIGCEDPVLGDRSGLVRKDEDTAVLPMFFKPVETVIERDIKRAMSPSQRFQDLLNEIGPRYHEPIRHAIAYYCRTVENVDTHELKELIVDAVWAAPAGKSPKSQYTNNSYLDRLIGGALRKYH